MLVIILPFILLRSFLVCYLLHDGEALGEHTWFSGAINFSENGVTRNDDDNDEQKRVIKNDLMKYIVRSIYIDLPWMFINPSLECFERQKKYREIPEEEKAQSEFRSYSMGLLAEQAAAKEEHELKQEVH